MSENLQKRNKDSKEVAEDGIERSIDNEDIESIQVAGEGEAKGGATAEPVYNLITFL
ncbi:MAG: hypothetical protein ACJ72J_02100 [Nitrososphaeraceae archaeon]